MSHQDAENTIQEFDKEKRGRLGWSDFKNMIRHKNRGTRFSRGQWRYIRRNFNKYAGSSHTLDAEELIKMSA